MDCFIVVSEDIDSALIEQKFPYNYALTPSAWAIGGEGTCGDICDKLGLSIERGGVVVKLVSYNGYFDRNLWEKIDYWHNIKDSKDS